MHGLFPQNILHNHLVRFLIGRLLYSREIGDSGYAKFRGKQGPIMVCVKMANALLEHLLLTTLFFYYFLFSPLCAEYKHLQHTRTAVPDLFFS